MQIWPICALSDSAVDVTVGDTERADLLNSYFSTVCTTDNSTDTEPIFNRSVPEGVDLDFVKFTPGKVHSAIKKLRTNGSCGPDGHPPLLFKRIIDSVAEPLSLIFTLLMSVGKVPMDWSHAIVTRMAHLLLFLIIDLYLWLVLRVE